MIDFGIIFGALALGVVTVVLPVAVWRYVFGWPKNKPKKDTPWGGSLK